MTFSPAKGRIWFEPITKKRIIQSDTQEVITWGKVLGIGDGVESCKIGDTIAFVGWGAAETPEMDGQVYWTLRDDSAFLLGILHD